MPRSKDPLLGGKGGHQPFAEFRVPTKRTMTMTHVLTIAGKPPQVS